MGDSRLDACAMETTTPKAETGGRPKGRPYTSTRMVLADSVEPTWLGESYTAIRFPRSRSELLTTKTLEKAIAAAANMGSKPPSMATGISTRL